MMDCKTVKELSYEDVELYTKNFSDDNLIGKFQWGRIFRGLIGAKPVVVKKWEDPLIYLYYEGENEERFNDELQLLLHPEGGSHPNMVKLIGYCNEGEERLAVVYDLEAVDSVYNLVRKDTFTWLQRIKVILGFARVLDFFHAQTPVPCLVRNISAAHILVDENANAKLFDFSFMTGGVFPERRSPGAQYVRSCYGYISFDPKGIAGWSEKVDVFAFGIVLLMLISKRVLTDDEIRFNLHVEFINVWARNVYKPRKKPAKGGDRPEFTLVHEDLQKHAGFCGSDGDKIEKLAMRCVGCSTSRPEMGKVLWELLKVKDVKRILGEHQVKSLKQKLATAKRVILNEKQVRAYCVN